MAPQVRVTGDVNLPDVVPVTGAAPEPSATSIPTPTPTFGRTTYSNSNNNGNSNTDRDSNGFDSGGYIIMIMSVSVLVTAVFFARVCLAKRREKRQLQKNFDCEVPPGYEFHLTDIALYNSRMMSAPVQDIASSPSPASATVIQHPPPAALAGRHSIVPANPPSYESLLDGYSFQAASASASSSEPTSLTASSSSSHPPPPTST